MDSPDKRAKGVSLPAAIQKAIAEAPALLGGRRVAFVAEYPAHLPSVSVGLESLARILGTIVSRVAEVSRSGQLTLRAELLPAGEAPEILDLVAGDPPEQSQEGPWALLYVSSSNVRLADEPFQNLILELEDRGQGEHPPETMTLSACVETVESAGGRVWIEKVTESQVRVSIVLPLLAAGEEEPDSAMLRQAVVSHLPDTGEYARSILLMVEDDAVGEPLAHDLVQEGYWVLLAHSGSEVLAVARRQHPDLILLDMLARDPTAMDVALVLRQDPRVRDIPVLFMTSADNPQGGVRLGTIDFEVKPFDTGALVQTIEDVLRMGIGPKQRVLVVEPDEDLRETMSGLMRQRGYVITEAGGPEEALAIAERIAPAVVMVNAGLAQERDYWLLRSLRRLSSETEILVLSRAITEAEGRAALIRGASGYGQTGRLREILEKVQKRTEEREEQVDGTSAAQ